MTIKSYIKSASFPKYVETKSVFIPFRRISSKQYLQVVADSKNDFIALRSDWEKIGGDLSVAIEKYKNNECIGKK